MFEKRGELFVVSAPSGAGKTTLCSMLMKKFSTLSYSVSYTTRPPRTGEVNGVHYNFVDTNTFEYMVSTGDFIEYAKVHGNMYGTSKKYIETELNAGKNILLDIDPQGAMQLKESADYGVFIFILPPSMAALRERLTARNDTCDSLELRLENAIHEIETIPSYDYVIINDNLDHAFTELCAVYAAEQCRVSRIVDYNAFLKNR